MVQSSSSMNVAANLDPLDVKKIQSIATAIGWNDVNDCELVQFAVGESHSPISTPKLYPTLRYSDQNGRTVWTPLSHILAFSDQRSQGSSQSGATEGSYAERVASR